MTSRKVLQDTLRQQEVNTATFRASLFLEYPRKKKEKPKAAQSADMLVLLSQKANIGCILSIYIYIY